MSDPTDHGTTPAAESDHDLGRRRRMWLIPLVGTGLGLVLAVGVGLAGGRGRAGAAVWLLVTAAASGIGALYGIATALLDDLRDEPVSLRRVGGVVGLFFVAAALMAMVAGIGG